jgi:hypothetical protein
MPFISVTNSACINGTYYLILFIRKNFTNIPNSRILHLSRQGNIQSVHASKVRTSLRGLLGPDRVIKGTKGSTTLVA